MRLLEFSPRRPEVHLRGTFQCTDRSAFWAVLRAEYGRSLDQGQAFVIILNGVPTLADDKKLSQAERRRADAFRRAEDRSNFVLGRTVIQELLSPPEAPQLLPVLMQANQKPYVQGAPHFSLSHSGACVAAAVSPTGLIGVDIEIAPSVPHSRDLATTVAHPFERDMLDACPDTAFSALFSRCWTRKEAVFKAMGLGLTADPRALDTRLHEWCPPIECASPMRVVDIFEDGTQASAAVAFCAETEVLNIALINVAAERESKYAGVVGTIQLPWIS
jgi:phosphopantetheinyl transferase